MLFLFVFSLLFRACLRSYVDLMDVLINKEIPKVTYYYVLILNLNLKCIINFLKVISISKEYFI